MYAIRVRLDRCGGRPPAPDPARPGAAARPADASPPPPADSFPLDLVALVVREAVGYGLPPEYRLEHLRVGPDETAFEALLFVAGDGLLGAEREVGRALAAATSPGALLADWRLAHCEADSWLTLGLHEESARP